MIDKLLALVFPPGLFNTGTVYQSKGRWHDGNGVRFHQGNIQPVGGWVARSTTGATINGTPNAAFAWQTNAGLSWLAIGTTTNLYVVSSTNVVYDITPTTAVQGSLRWQLDNFGNYLVAVTNDGSTGSGTATSGANIVYWDGVTTGTAAAIVTVDSPYSAYGVVTTQERFLMVLRGTDTGADYTGTFEPVAGRVN